MRLFDLDDAPTANSHMVGLVDDAALWHTSKRDWGYLMLSGFDLRRGANLRIPKTRKRGECHEVHCLC